MHKLEAMTATLRDAEGGSSAAYAQGGAAAAREAGTEAKLAQVHEVTSELQQQRLRTGTAQQQASAFEVELAAAEVLLLLRTCRE